MKLDVYQVDAFAESLFTGNPASVIPFYEWPSDDLMQKIAMENNQSETAFFVPKGEYFELRWFTPEFEIDLCGHATMAAAHVIYEHMDYSDPAVVFVTKSGRLFVDREREGIYTMDFPAWPPRELQVTERVAQSIGVRPEALYANDRDMMAVIDSEKELRAIKPDMRLINELDCVCLIVTAKGEEHDFVSRVFCPGAGIPEDPVTGSAHCALVPYWAERLNRDTLKAYQVSRRGGALSCKLAGDRIRLSGKAMTYMRGVISL